MGRPVGVKHDNFNIFDRVSDLMNQAGHPDPENAPEGDRFEFMVGAILKAGKIPVSPKKDD